MSEVSLERLLPGAGNSLYKLVILASKRASELDEGQSPLVEVKLQEKSITIALREIAEGKITLGKDGDGSQDAVSSEARTEAQEA